MTGDIIRSRVEKTESGEEKFSVSSVTLANGVKLEFSQVCRPFYVIEGDKVEIDYRKESGGSENSPRVTITRPGLGNVIYDSNLPAECIK